jgi:4'-phosphopantetheinyl transferase
MTGTRKIKEVRTPEGDQKRPPATSWSQAPLPLAFPTARVDIWKVCFDQPPKAGCEASILSPDEIARAGRFHFEKDRIQFTRCRCALRRILADYLAIAPGEIRFEYLISGKPQLAADQNPRALEFNVSHSANIALIAVSSEHRLGVDVEKIRGDVDVEALAERFFSPRERDGIRALPDLLRVPGFFACWTRKEAFLKATGAGLSFPLADFSVTTHPDHAPEIEDISGNREGGKPWFLSDLHVIDGYRAAVVLESPHLKLETYAWE